MYYDFAGAAGFLSTTFVSLYYPSLRAKFWDKIPGAVIPSIQSFAPRQLLATAALSMWSLRLGTFLASVSSCIRDVVWTVEYTRCNCLMTPDRER